jgi:uncharacterized protein YjbI with pentapeptide repeats
VKWIFLSLGIISILAVVGVLISGYVFEIGWTGVDNKKLWDWLDLLIVPVVLTGGGI